MRENLVEEILGQTESLLQKKEFIIIAIDGRCASGKTTLANELKKKLNCTVLHTDDFFLRPEQRTEKRFSEPGGNIDYERFLDEVINPLKENKAFSYRPYDCHTQSFKKATEVNPERITVVEGSYSCHTKFGEYYDIKIFLDVDKMLQLERIKNRNGEAAVKIFKDKWIPLEENYFNTRKIIWRKYE